MSYIGTLVKHCDNVKSIEQETQKEITLQSATITLQSATITHQSATKNTATPPLIPAPACGYLYIIIYTKNSYRVSI